MKRIIAIYFLLSVSLLSFSQKKEEKLLVYPFNKAIKLQQETKKPIITFIYTDWCKFCFAMKKNTLQNKEVVQLLNKHFYFVKLNAESKESITVFNSIFKNITGIHQLAEMLATKNGTINYPTTTITDNKRVIREQITTFINHKLFIQLLNSYQPPK